MEIEKPSNLSITAPNDALDYSSVDETTRARIGSLCAHGLSDLQIADILLLTQEQVTACHNSPEYKQKYAEVAEERIQRQIDLEEGWDAVETAGIAQILETLKHNRDPKFALGAAAIANKAIRRKNSNGNQIVLDNSRPQENNVIILQLNKVYVNSSTNGENKTLDITPRKLEQPRQRSDLPSPKLVEEMLAPVRQNAPKQKTELEQLFEASGVVFDKDTR